MKETLKKFFAACGWEEFLGSKKVKMALSAMLVALLSKMGMSDVDPAMLLTIVSPALAMITGQSVVDIQKSKSEAAKEPVAPEETGV